MMGNLAESTQMPSLRQVLQKGLGTYGFTLSPDYTPFSLGLKQLAHAAGGRSVNLHLQKWDAAVWLRAEYYSEYFPFWATLEEGMTEEAISAVLEPFLDECNKVLRETLGIKLTLSNETDAEHVDLMRTPPDSSGWLNTGPLNIRPSTPLKQDCCRTCSC